mgnify:CR=1 FL=1
MKNLLRYTFVFLILNIFFTNSSFAAITNLNSALDTTSQNNTPTGIYFSNDGSKVFVLGSRGDGGDKDSIAQYSLSTAYDVSTASDSIETLIVGAGGLGISADPFGFTFNGDGSKVYIGDGVDDRIYEITLGSNFDLTSSATHTGTLNTNITLGEGAIVTQSTSGTTGIVRNAVSNSNTVHLHTVRTPAADVNVAVTVTNPSGSQNIFNLGGVANPANYSMTEGTKYIFNQDDASNDGHPMRISITRDGETLSAGVVYKLDGTTVTMAGYVSGFGSATTRTIEMIVQPNAPAMLYYWCHFHTGQGNGLVITDPYTDISGATSPSYSTGTTTYAADNGDRFRCKLSAIGADADEFTSAALLTVYRTHNITSQPNNATGNEGGTSSYTVAGNTSSGSHTYQWSKSDNGVDYNTIPGATSATYTTPTLVFADDNDDRFKCTLSLEGAENDLVSVFAVQTVLRVISISQQPQPQTVIEGQSATFSITAVITSGSLNYQWQRSQDNGNNWSTIIGATSSSYTTPAQPFPTVNNLYRCVLSNSNAISLTSDAAAITVNESEFVEAAASMSINIDDTTNLTFNRQPVFTAGDFVSQYAGSTHYASYWLIKRAADNVTVYDTASITVPDLSGGDTGNLTTFTVPVGILEFDITYEVSVRYKDNAGLVSSYSAPVQFATPVVDQPEVQTITPAFNPTINVLTPEFKAGYGHNSTDWQFSAAETFVDIEHQSLGNSTNLQSYTLPGDVTLLPTTTYYVRVRFNVDTV